MQAKTEEEARLDARGSIISSELRKIESMCCCNAVVCSGSCYAVRWGGKDVRGSRLAVCCSASSGGTNSREGLNLDPNETFGPKFDLKKLN